MTAGYQLTAGQMSHIREAVRHYLNLFGGNPRGHGGADSQGVVTGATIGTITAATGALTGATTFTFALLRGTSAGNLEDSTLRLTGTNRDTTLTALDGTLLYLARVDGEWRPIWVGCEPDAALTGLT